MGDLNKACTIMYDLVTDPKHGYSQENRNGPDYDCSSSVSKALHDAGFDIPYGCNTSSIYKYLLAIGFELIDKDKKPQKGDIWLRRRDTPLAKKKGSGHVVLMWSDKRVMEFSSSRGHHKKGDQTGTESWVHDWNPNRKYDFEFLLRYKPGQNKDEYYRKYAGNSRKIDEVFKSIGAPYGSWKIRKPVGVKNGFRNYTGTANQNMKLIALAKQGKLKKV
ncbi:peptidoglycan amidohydrolase family protein [Sharpea azabuensis]|uniref:peptidoglycan amidohydrolase family protein n=1 Tax=Sharpea azabuensis TaxID=322505 RepID=UPI00156942A8|nr:peptidoglycan amidohydrolase family protein [Sharpea azabuensis]